jgi:hypothetical protein
MSKKIVGSYGAVEFFNFLDNKKNLNLPGQQSRTEGAQSTSLREHLSQSTSQCSDLHTQECPDRLSSQMLSRALQTR